MTSLGIQQVKRRRKACELLTHKKEYQCCQQFSFRKFDTQNSNTCRVFLVSCKILLQENPITFSFESYKGEYHALRHIGLILLLWSQRIDTFDEYHNAADKYQTMHHFATVMCTRAHFCYKIMHCEIWDWCIVKSCNTCPHHKVTSAHDREHWHNHCCLNLYLNWLFSCDNPVDALKIMYTFAAEIYYFQSI